MLWIVFDNGDIHSASVMTRTVDGDISAAKEVAQDMIDAYQVGTREVYLIVREMEQDKLQTVVSYSTEGGWSDEETSYHV